VHRWVLAPNASALTLDGTRTHLVGETRLVVLDPGSDAPSHLAAIEEMVGGGDVTAVVVSHHHPDHEGGARELARRLGAPLLQARLGTLREGDRLETDAGELVALATPGHTPDHFSLHWPSRDTVFCGDMMMGGQDTSLVAAPEGRLAAYLASLERIRRLEPRVIHPAHGPTFQDPGPALARYVRHRRLRLAQVQAAVAGGSADYPDLLRAVYGPGLDPAIQGAAMAALKAYLEHLHAQGRVRRVGRGWEAVAS
jgi:glyoxylase-like metal-dependent hydrolase (beta-lactamase superfamily II)